MSSNEINEIVDLALNYWRLSNWVEKIDSKNKKSAQHSLRQMKKYLDSHGIELIDITGQPYDSGYAADVLGIESDHKLFEDECIVIEMVRPIILHNGSVVQFGKVVLGENLKCINDTEECTPKRQINMLIKEIDDYCSSSYKTKPIAKRLMICKSKLEHWIIEQRSNK